MIISIGDRESELVRLFDIGPELVTPFYLLMHRDLQRTPRVRAFFDFVICRNKGLPLDSEGDRSGEIANQPDRFSLQRALQGTT